MRHLHRLPALCVAFCWLGTPTAMGQTPRAPLGPAAGVVDQLRDITVWSAPAPGGYALMAATAAGVRQLPVAPRAVPFDADLGTDSEGGIVATYSRCSTEPLGPRDALNRGIFTAPGHAYTTGKGCDLYVFSFATGRESRIAGASTGAGSEMLPSYSNGSLAFVRTYPSRRGKRGVYPYVYLTRASKTVRLAGGPRGVAGLPGPTSLDLSGRTVGLVWNYGVARKTRGASEVRVTSQSRGSRRIAHTTLDMVNSSYASFLTPTLSGGRIYYGYERIQGLTSSARPPVSAVHQLFRVRLSNGQRARATAPAFLMGLGIDGAQIAFGSAGDGERYLVPAGSVTIGASPMWSPVANAQAAESHP